MLIQAGGALVHARSGTELSRVRSEFRLRLPEPIHKSPLESRGPTLLCNHVDFKPPVTRRAEFCEPPEWLATSLPCTFR
jgi:hypothetical protein